MEKLIRSHVQKLHAYVPGLQPAPGQRIIKLNTNENPYPLPLREADWQQVTQVAAERGRLYPNPTSLSLRSRLAELHGLDVDCIIVGNGADEILSMIFIALGADSGQVVSVDPTYSLYTVLTDIEDRPYKEVPTREDFSIDFEALVAAAQPGDTIIFPNPNAPTGLGIEAQVLLERARANPELLWVIDEAYAGFGAQSLLDAAGPTELPNLIVSRTLSKSHSAAGIRCGYAVGPKPLIEALNKVRDSYNMNLLTQLVAERVLSQPGLKQVEQALGAIQVTRQWTTDKLQNLGFSVTDSQANFVFAKPPLPHNAKDLYEKLKDQGILVRYFASNKRTQDWLRITIGLDRDMKEFIDVLTRILSR